MAGVAVENNYLSQKQQAQKKEELAECKSISCKAQTQAKWTAIDLGQDGSFAAGMVAVFSEPSKRRLQQYKALPAGILAEH